MANYFDVLIQAPKAKDNTRAMSLSPTSTSQMKQDWDSPKGKPRGRGWGQAQAKQLYDRLSGSKAVSSGKLQDLGDFELLVPGIGSDKISDLAINVIRGEADGIHQRAVRPL